MPAAMIALSPDLERLIDERLDAVDRILSLSQTARSERMQILSDLESQIRDRLAARTSEEPTRADLLAVFSELDPPEAYLDEVMPNETPFRGRSSQAEVSRQHSGASLVASLPARKNTGGRLALWAGFIVSIGCLLTPCSLFSLMALSDLAILPVLLLQFAILCGSVLAIINLSLGEPRTELNRLVSWACIGTIPWTLAFIVGWFPLLFGSTASGLLQIVAVYAIPCGAIVHGIWLGFFTLRYLLEHRNARSR